MADVRVRFVGDLGNLTAFDQAIRNSARQTAESFRDVNKRLGESVGPLTGGKDAAGLMLKNSRVTVDAINNTFRQSTDIVRRYLSGYKESVDKATGLKVSTPLFSDLYVGSIQRATGNVQAYLAAARAVAPIEARINEVYARRAPIISALSQAANEQQLRVDEAQKVLSNLDARHSGPLSQARSDLGAFSEAEERRKSKALQDRIDLEEQFYNKGHVRAATPGGSRPGTADELKYAKTGIDALRKQQAELKSIFATSRASLEKDLSSLTQVWETERAPLALAVEKEIATLQTANKQFGIANEETARQIAAIRSKYKTLLAAPGQAFEATRPIPAQFEQLLKTSPQLLKALQKQGLGVNAAGARTQFGTGDFQKTLAQQELEVKSIVRDITKGETQLRLGYTNLGKGPGLLKSGYQEATVAIADNGNVITKWSGILSGSNNLITQFGRNVQRSFGYLISGALTFGSLGLLVAGIHNINELDANLQRLSITAQTSGAQTSQLFRDLGKIAIETATPIEQVVSAADDIALAVQQSGQSVDDYHDKIVALTEAVGIFTNLTGTDTVQATDLLSSTFKQLQVNPEELIGILSKITTVAGGQSKSIQDIAEGLGSVAAAGKAGSLSINEMIGTLQVLSQVTAKSPAEVAVAFKNLIGSLASPGGIKALKSVGINVKDELGNVRNIIEVYKELSDKIASGEVPTGRVQEIVRGISGGPRRAPDATALLGNIDSVIAQTGVAASATNEALIANARILDTNTAKITQFQNALKIAFFETFGPAVKDVLGNLAQVGTVLLGFTRNIPTALIATLIQLGALLLSFGLLKKLLGTFAVPFFGGLRRDLSALIPTLSGVTVGFQEAAVAKAEFEAVNTASGIRYKSTATGQFVNTATAEAALAAQSKGGILSRIPKVGRIGNIVGLTALGATAANYAGGKDSDSAAQLLQVGGVVASFVPQLRLLGIAATIAGTGMSLFGASNKEAEASIDQNANAIYDAINAYQTAQRTLENATTAQKGAIQAIQTAQKPQDLTKAGGRLPAAFTPEVQGLWTPRHEAAVTAATTGINDLKKLYTDYSSATEQVITANSQVAESFQKILSLEPELRAQFGQLQFLSANGGLDSDSLNKYQEKLAIYFLNKNGGNFKSPEELLGSLAIPEGFRTAPVGTSEVKSRKQEEYYAQHGLVGSGHTNPDGSITRDFFADINDLTKLEGKDLADKLKVIFSDDSIWTPTKANLEIIADALGRVGDNLDKVDLDAFNAKFRQLAVNTDTLVASGARLESVSQYLKAGESVGALGFTPDQVAEASKYVQVAQDLLRGAGTLPSGAPSLRQGSEDGRNLRNGGVGPQGPGTQTDVANLVNNILNPLTKEGKISIPKLNKQEGVDIFKDILAPIPGQLDLFNKLNKEAQEAVAGHYWSNLGIEISGLTTKITANTEAEKENALGKQRAIELQKELTNAAQERAERESDLAVALSKGEFSGKGGPERYRALQAQSDALYQGKRKTARSIEDALGDGTAKERAQNLREIERAFAKLPGFEDAATLSAQQFIDKLYNQAEALGGTKTQIDSVTKFVQTLIDKWNSFHDKDVSLTLHQNTVITTTYGPKPDAALGVDDVGSGGVAYGLPGGGGTPQKPGANDGRGGRAAQPLPPPPPKPKVKLIPGTNIPSTGDPSLDALYKQQYEFYKGQQKSLNTPPPEAPKAPKSLNYGQIELDDDIKKSEELKLSTPQADVKAIIAGALELQKQIPGEKDRNKDDRVAITSGLKVLANTEGISSELLRKSMDNLADIEKKRLDFDTKADQIRRIRVGSGSFAAIANVPFNSTSGVSVGSPNNITININGAGLTPAQYAVFADKVASEIKRSIASG